MSDRSEWLATLKVGDKIVWEQYGRVRGIFVIERETPKHWSINDGWLVSKATGCSVGLMSGIVFQRHVKGVEAKKARQERGYDRHQERINLLDRIGRFSTKRLRAFAASNGRTPDEH